MINNYMYFKRKEGRKTSYLLNTATIIDERIAPKNKRGERILSLREVYPPERAVSMNAKVYLQNANTYLSRLEYFNINYPTYSLGDIKDTNDLLIFNLLNDELYIYILENKKPFISEVKGLFENESIFDNINEILAEEPIININECISLNLVNDL